MKEADIKKLIKIVEESNIDELEISRWGKKIKITKHSGLAAPVQVAAPVEIPVPAPAEPEKEAAPEPEVPEIDAVEVMAPMVGTFYRSPAPDADSYVNEGDRVKVGDILCIVEAMKLMNEIESEVAGIVRKILVDDAKPVQYNQPMFLIEKA